MFKMYSDLLMLSEKDIARHVTEKCTDVITSYLAMFFKYYLSYI